MQSTHPVYPFRLALMAAVLSLLPLAACVPLETAGSATTPHTLMPQILIVQSEHTLDSNEAKRANMALTKAIWLELTNAEAYLHRAEAHYELDEYELAIADVDKAFELNPWDPFVYALRSKIYQALGRHDEARTDFERAVKKAVIH